MLKSIEKRYQEAKKASEPLLANDTFVEASVKNTAIHFGFTEGDKLTPVAIVESNPSISLFGGFFSKRSHKLDVKLKESLIDNQIQVR